MDRSAIIAELTNKYKAVADLVAAMPDEDFVYSLNGEKWTAGQQIEHLCKSVEPLNKGLRAPEFALKAMFGTSDHPSLSYEELVTRYRHELASGGTAPPSFRPEPVPFDRKDEITAKLLEEVAKLCRNIEKCDEAKLDVLVLPHPLLGKLTFREMFYFTIYHAEHHHKHIMRNLAGRTS